MSLQPIPIFGYDNQGGLKLNKKPLLIPDQAFQTLENMWVFRDRVQKRDGIKLLGQLQRNLVDESLGNSGASPWTVNIFSTLAISQPNPVLVPGSVIITLGTTVFTDQGNGLLTSTVPGNSGTINYISGIAILTYTGGTGQATTISFSYYPLLPVMGTTNRETLDIVATQTVWFDQNYAYIWTGNEFSEFVPGTTWAGSDSDFFWWENYRGVTPDSLFFFVTNFVNDAADPIRYYNGSTWTNFSPAVDASNFLFQARIIIAYFGRLLALNVWEGPNIGGSINVRQRCRFSAVGNPVATNAWRSDIVGQGGFIDAPTSEAIISAEFLNNTLIVQFERTTWQLRYVGEYGIPFIWERIASDLGSDSTFSIVLFNRNILAVGDRALIAADSNSVERIDLDIPDQIFTFQNANFGTKRVQGVRDYQKEVVYWCFADSNTQAAPGTPTTFPNRVLLYNYRNSTWAIFRDNITSLGTFQSSDDVTWDNQTITWDSETVTWDNFDTQSDFPLIVSGNQQGFVHYYQQQGPEGRGSTNANEQESLMILGIASVGGGLRITSPNHNLATDEIIYITDMMFVDSVLLTPIATSLNNNIYQVRVFDANTLDLFVWNFSSQSPGQDFPYTPDLSTATYIGGGYITLFPKPIAQTKDFNPFQTKGLQTKMSRIDFLLNAAQAPPIGNIQGATNANPCVITSADHGLFSGQQVYISMVQGMTQLNISSPYRIIVLDDNTFSIGVDSTLFGIYTMLGEWMLSHAGMSIELKINSSQSLIQNLAIGNNQVANYGVAPFYVSGSDYAWHRFYATVAGQYFNITMTYDNNLMNTLTSHQQELVVNAMNVMVRPGGNLPF